MTSRREHAITTRGGAMVVSSPARSFSDVDWVEHMHNAWDALKEGTIVAVLVYSPYAGPSAVQRAELRRTFGKLDLHALPRVAMVSGSAIARAGIAGVGPFLKLTYRAELKAFRPEQIEVACSWLSQVASATPQEMIAALEELKRAQGHAAQV